MSVKEQYNSIPNHEIDNLLNLASQSNWNFNVWTGTQIDFRAWWFHFEVGYNKAKQLLNVCPEPSWLDLIHQHWNCDAAVRCAVHRVRQDVVYEYKAMTLEANKKRNLEIATTKAVEAALEKPANIELTGALSPASLEAGKLTLLP